MVLFQMIIKATRSHTVLVPVQVKEYSRRHFYTVESKTVGTDVSVIKYTIVATEVRVLLEFPFK